MTTDDPVFIENNICSIHDEIINNLIAIREWIIGGSERGVKLDINEVTPYLEELILETRKAKEKGIKIEGRLKVYLYTIRALGFSRDKEAAEIEIINNRLTLKPKDGTEENGI